MLISTREAAAILAARVPSFEQTRHLLATGVVGRPVQVGRTIGYDECLVSDLASRPVVDEHRLAEACPAGVYVARLGRHRWLDTASSWEEQARSVAPQPALTPMTAALIGVRRRLADGGLPWVATVSGFVVFGGEATGWRRGEDSSVVDLEPPGAWYQQVDGRWWPFGRGRHWCLWDPWRLQQ
jgi:hypothetical protein